MILGSIPGRDLRNGKSGIDRGKAGIIDATTHSRRCRPRHPLQSHSHMGSHPNHSTLYQNDKDNISSSHDRIFFLCAALQFAASGATCLPMPFCGRFTVAQKLQGVSFVLLPTFFFNVVSEGSVRSYFQVHVVQSSNRFAA